MLDSGAARVVALVPESEVYKVSFFAGSARVVWFFEGSARELSFFGSAKDSFLGSASDSFLEGSASDSFFCGCDKLSFLGVSWAAV